MHSWRLHALLEVTCIAGGYMHCWRLHALLGATFIAGPNEGL